MSDRRCIVHPENQCQPAAGGGCVCAPPGMAHATGCAALTRGKRCNCDVARSVRAGVAELWPFDADIAEEPKL